MAKFTATSLMNFAKPKVGAEHQLLFNKPASGVFLNFSVELTRAFYAFYAFYTFVKRTRLIPPVRAHRSHEADEDHDGGDKHDAEADDHQGFSSGAFDEDEADEGHADVDDAHAEGGLESLALNFLSSSPTVGSK